MGAQGETEPGIYSGDLPELNIHHTRIAVGVEPGVLAITESGEEKRLVLAQEHGIELRGIEKLLQWGLDTGVDRFTADEGLVNLKTWFTQNGEENDEIESALRGVADHINHVARRTARQQARQYGQLIHDLSGTVLAITHADSADIYGITAAKGHFNVARLRGLLLDETTETIHAQAVVDRTVGDVGVVRRVGGLVCLIETKSLEE